MADQSDVENALVTAVTTALYPNGLVGSPPLTVAGCPARIGRGWPAATALDPDLAAGILNVSVYPRPGMERNTTRVLARWEEAVAPVVTLTAVVAGHTVTLGGTISTPQNIAVTVGRKAYAHAVSGGDTLASIATALAALINADTPASAAGPVITIPNAFVITAAVGGAATMVKEMKRAEKVFQIIFWCPTPAIRDAAVAAVDAALCQQFFLQLADGSAARLRYQGTSSNDAPEKENLYRRDLLYCVEYATFATEQAYQAVVVETNLEDQAGDIIETVDI